MEKEIIRKNRSKKGTKIVKIINEINQFLDLNKKEGD